MIIIRLYLVLYFVYVYRYIPGIYTIPGWYIPVHAVVDNIKYIPVLTAPVASQVLTHSLHLPIMLNVQQYGSMDLLLVCDIRFLSRGLCLPRSCYLSSKEESRACCLLSLPCVWRVGGVVQCEDKFTDRLALDLHQSHQGRLL